MPASLSITRENYRDKVYGGWLGKNIGSTLGTPLEGRKDMAKVEFFDPIPGQAVASDVLDIQLVWMNTIREHGIDLTSDDLAVAFEDHFTYSWDEYGYAQYNLRRGLNPPLSGAFNNWFKTSSGAVNRTEIWAMIAPGSPQVASRHAWLDATLDHTGEGVWAAMFWAAMESAAFFVADPNQLIDIGLAMIPSASKTAQSVRAVLDAVRERVSLFDARNRILAAVGCSNFTDAPQNVGFALLGLFYGNGFGEKVCSVVNCGYDAGGNGSMTGALLGILNGKSGIPANWLDPVGDSVVMGWGVRKLEADRTVADLTAHTVEIGERVVAEKCSDIALVDAVEPPAPPVVTEPVAAPAVAEEPGNAPVSDQPVDAVQAAVPADAQTIAPPPDHPVEKNWKENSLVQPLLSTSPYTLVYKTGPFEIEVDYGDQGPVILPNVARSITMVIRNRSNSDFLGHVQLKAPSGWQVAVPGAQGQRQMLARGGMARYGFVLKAPEGSLVNTRNSVTLVLTPEEAPPFVCDVNLLGGACWRWIGPLKNVAGDGYDRVFPVEDNQGFDDRYLARGDSLVAWTKMAFAENSFPLEQLFFTGLPGVAYGATSVYVPEAMEARLVAHASDGVKVKLNNRMVLQRHSHEDIRPTLGYGPCSADVVLLAGENRVLVKVVRCDNPAEFSFAVTDRDGMPLLDMGNTKW